ncbi:MAG TPA: UDP-4-amino-4,6-dideoxy-N-acetyl-beta-L-altrosamine transaminase [Sulfurospirillum arcachonense]|nr:UDP-4-amino-4,6-dideoxy-N-acetyl-beta-L-altrosamine transaminase [Sulfurospirillum arcachonense]
MIPYSRQSINDEDIQAVIDTLKSDFLTGGKKVDEFEKALGEYLGVKYVCVMNSATSALHIAYLCIGLEKNDEVITTPITFAATANAVLMCRAKPVFCDIKNNGNIDEEKIEKLINKNTKAIAPIDFGGNPINIDKIKEICEKNKLFLVQDCSHALGSEINGKKVGSQADIAIFSFHAIKPITTCGEGGAIATNNKELYEKAKLLRSHGMVKKQLWDSDMLTLGYNYRLSDVSCALGLSQLKRLDTFIEKRADIAKYYDKRFQNNPYFTVIKKPLHVTSARHLYPILLNRSLWCAKEDIFKELQNKGIGVQVHYKPTYQFSYYKELFGEIKLQNAEEFYKAELSIPCHQGMSEKDTEYIVKSLLDILLKCK